MITTRKTIASEEFDVPTVSSLSFSLRKIEKMQSIENYYHSSFQTAAANDVNNRLDVYSNAA